MAPEASVLIGTRTERAFYTGASLAIVVAVFVGFAPTYFLKGYFHAPPLPLLYHVHGLVFSGWILLFVAQTALIAGHRVDLHRRLGAGGAGLAGAVIVVGLAIAIVSARRNFAGGNVGALQFLAIPFGDMFVFGMLAAAGLYYRRRRDVHKRLMFLATISILGAAFARWPFAIMANGPTAFFATTDVFIVAGVVHDFVSQGRVHPANIWGGMLVVASQPLRLAIAGTDTWLAFARAVVS
jgi:hypothetical protein